MGRFMVLCTVVALGFVVNILYGSWVLLVTPTPSSSSTTWYYRPPSSSPLPVHQEQDVSGQRKTQSESSPYRATTTSSFTNANVRSSSSWNRTAALTSKLLSDKCFYVEDICRSSHRWFYRPQPSVAASAAGAPSNRTEGKDDEDEDNRKRQPDVLLMKEYKDFRRWVLNPSYRHSYRFETPNVSSFMRNSSDWERCVDSPIENHLVMFTFYNEMLGEFYDKALMFLWLLSREFDWVKHAQLYLHMYMPFRRMLDSHHLFTAPFRTNPLLDFTTLLDEPSCTCLPRLFLCGYDVIQTNSSYTESSIDADSAASANASSTAGVTILEPGKSLWRRNENLYPNPDDMFRDLRTHMRQSVIDTNPGTRQDIRSYREKLLAESNVPESEWSEWKVVGLAQRSGRRRWRDLSTVRSQAQRVLRQQHTSKVVLVEVNVESRTSSPYQQVVWHGALDALVGIHGAQMTEAIWLKPGSWVVELLPYNPKGLYMGHWVTYTDRPTPLGEYFHRTDLNLASYPLQRDSAPYCYDDNPNDHPDDPLLCWRQKNNPWDERDFVLDAASLVQILNRTILVQSPEALCHDYPDTRDDRVVVLGNLNCAITRQDPVEPHHFHWINATDTTVVA